MNKIKIIEWFGGVSAYTQASKRQYGKDNIEVVDYVELDKHAVKSCNAIHGTSFVPTDINNVDVANYPEVDILVAGFPCQDYSIAGKGLGLDGTRSSLILLTVSKIKEMKYKPKHILLENVKGLLSKKHIDDLAYIRELFDELGYNWDQAMLNSKYFGVPQSRERVYMLLTRKDLPQKHIKQLEERKTVDKVLRDVLDFSVPTHTQQISDKCGKVYFTNEMSQYNGKIIQLDIDKLNDQKRDGINKIATLGTLEGVEFKDHTVNQVKGFTGVEGQYQTYTENHGTGNQIAFKGHSFNQKKHFLGVDGVAKTLRVGDCDAKGKVIYNEDLVIHYRKLTSLECWRLMGFPDEAHQACVNVGVSNSQLCKQAGNSIVANVLEAINEEVFKKEQ